MIFKKNKALLLIGLFISSIIICSEKIEKRWVVYTDGKVFRSLQVLRGTVKTCRSDVPYLYPILLTTEDVQECCGYKSFEEEITNFFWQDETALKVVLQSGKIDCVQVTQPNTGRELKFLLCKK